MPAVFAHLHPEQPLKAFLDALTQRLLAHDLSDEEAQREALLVAEKALMLSPLELLAQQTKPLSSFAHQARFITWAQRRLQGELLSRLQGKRAFWKDMFIITPDVLDPRPETEQLVACALQHFASKPPPRFLELGTGSGCLVCSLLKEWPKTEAVAVDLSAKALLVTHKNAAALGVDKRLQLSKGSWFQALPAEESAFDLIVSNPPYIATKELAHLAAEVRLFDPSLALDGGAQGLLAIKEILEGAPAFLTPQGLLLVEIGFDQKKAVLSLAKDFFEDCTVMQDLSGHDRVLVCKGPRQRLKQQSDQRQ
ncbi:MAG: peptide chain release factor N(5)-glutamine methyltransferase [Holosporaceae bacterium]